MKLNYIDLFCGAGGLGEGFQMANYHPVYINDIDTWALKTCILRKIYWDLLNNNQTDIYYDYINNHNGLFDPEHLLANNDSPGGLSETLASNEELNSLNLKNHIKSTQNNLKKLDLKKIDVIAGGPPCQAYSYSARSRFSKINNAEWGSKSAHKRRKQQLYYDKRHHLYEYYLEIIKYFTPKVFVYENVPGLLTAKSKENNHPGAPSYVINRFRKDFMDIAGEYQILPLAPVDLEDTGKLNFTDFIVNASEYGVPQNRKRFIMIGFRKDLFEKNNAVEIFWDSVEKYKIDKPLTVDDAIRDFPPLQHDSGSEMYKKITGKNRPKKYGQLMRDKKLKYILNYTSRSHMESDLLRYKWYADFAFKNKRNATLRDLPAKLFPNHRSADALLNGNRNGKGVHVDRFKVKLWDRPSTTITAHLSKDGHAHIHPDPEQNRSITVREAARIQSFPDNYVFCGNRSHQFRQVGNAVPPILANVIAESIKSVIL